MGKLRTENEIFEERKLLMKDIQENLQTIIKQIDVLINDIRAGNIKKE